MRNCEICQATANKLLHHQSFVVPVIDEELSYDIVLCEQCGFIYADNIPNQSELDLFYTTAQHHLHSIDVPSGLSSIHAAFFSYIKKNIPAKNLSNVLDVGSSMGHFLNYFKVAGIEHILGLEPSLAARALAKKHYNIDVISNNLEQFHSEDKYKVITLCGVLEHINQVKQTIDKLNTLLDDSGYVFIAVPDAASFGKTKLKEPYLEFALEHINFFTKTSLKNIFISQGFELLACKSEYYDFYNNYYLLAIFKKQASNYHNSELVQDNSGESSINSYIINSDKLLNGIYAQLTKLIISQEPLIVWGAGSFTTRLCASTQLKETNLIGFIDKNVQLQGQFLLGKPIYSPDWVKYNRANTMLIASSTYADEIKLELINKYEWTGKIIVISALN